MKTLIAAFKFFLFALLSLSIVPFQIAVILVHKGRYSYVLPHIWHKGVCRIFNIRLHMEGAPLNAGHVLYVGNHISYLDIPALATRIGHASFVAKQDVSGWPVFGFLSKLQQTVFITRDRSAAARESNALEANLDQGKNLIIFPEGTSTEGIAVKPFKSSLFALLAQEKYKNLLIQPFTLSVLTTDGRPPQTREERLLYAWPFDDDTPLAAHLWRFARHGGAELRLTFHAPITARSFSDRKSLAKACQDAVSNGLSLQAA